MKRPVSAESKDLLTIPNMQTHLWSMVEAVLRLGLAWLFLETAQSFLLMMMLVTEWTQKYTACQFTEKHISTNQEELYCLARQRSKTHFHLTSLEKKGRRWRSLRVVGSIAKTRGTQPDIKYHFYLQRIKAETLISLSNDHLLIQHTEQTVNANNDFAH